LEIIDDNTNKLSCELTVKNEEQNIESVKEINEEDEINKEKFKDDPKSKYYQRREFLFAEYGYMKSEEASVSKIVKVTMCYDKIDKWRKYHSFFTLEAVLKFKSILQLDNK
jgi:hypothetical protein